MGSLLPDSSSIIGARCSLSRSFLLLRTENTDVESVELRIAASRKQTRMGIPHLLPKAIHTKSPVRMTVRNTPRLESIIPFLNTGFVSLSEVSKPAVNRIIVMAK